MVKKYVGKEYYCNDGFGIWGKLLKLVGEAELSNEQNKECFIFLESLPLAVW